MISIETLALAKKFTTGKVAEAIALLSGGVKYKGAVNYYADLPTDASEGDAYTVKFRGTSGTVADGSEYVWGKYEGTLQWILFGGAKSYTVTIM